MFISNYNHNPSFKGSIKHSNVDSLSRAEQYFSDCYIVSSLDTLSHSTNGRKLLRENIKYDDINPNQLNCYLYSKSSGRVKFSIPTDQVLKGYEKLYEHQQNPILRSVDVAVSQQDKQFKTKNVFSRIAGNTKDYNFEFGLPSQFMESMTGIKPSVQIAETDLNIDLKPYRKKVMKVFERMDKEKDHSFVIGTGVKKHDDRRFHVYVLEDVNLSNNTVTVKNKRGNKCETMSVDEALSTFKYIVGYFNEDLKK